MIGNHQGASTWHNNDPAAAGVANLVAKAIEIERADNGLAAVGDRSLRALPVEERHFAVFADQAEAVGVDRG